MRLFLKTTRWLALLSVMTLPVFCTDLLAGEKNEKGKLKIGEEAPAFTLKDKDDKEVSLEDFRDKKRVILAFSRAHW